MGRGATTAIVLVIGAVCFAAGWWTGRRAAGGEVPNTPSPALGRAPSGAAPGPVLEAGATTPSAARAHETTSPARAGYEEDVKPPPAAFLPVDVRLPDGSPADSFTIVLESAAETHTHAWRRDQGPLPVEGGAYEVHARAGPHGIHRSPPVPVVVPETGRASAITLRCARGTALVVHVHAKPDASFGRPSVLLLPLAPHADLDPVQLRKDGRQDSGTPDPDGWMAVAYSQLAPGRSAVGVKAWWAGPLVDSAVVTVTEGLTEQRFVLPSLPESDVVTVRVLAPDGRDLANPSFGLDYRGARSGESLQTPPAVRLPDGRWRLPIRMGDIAEDRTAQIQLSVTARGLGVRRIDVSTAGGQTVKVAFESPALLSVELAGTSNLPPAVKVRVELREQITAQSWTTPRPVSFDEDGRHIFAPRQPGPVLLRVLVMSGQREWRVASRRLDLTSGHRTVAVALPALHRVTFTGASPNETLGVQWEVDGETQHAWFDANGEGNAVAEALPEGEYTISAVDSRPAQTFRVTGPTEVRLAR